jgi:hypothetical protein
VSISQFMRSSVTVLDATEIPALQVELTRAQRRSKVALQRMRENYQDISDEVTFFGDPPDFIPFPQAGSFDISAVQTMLDRAFETARVAKEREDRALASNRAFDTDFAQFQSELSRVGTQFENDLGELCGLFQTGDGRSYPAIPKYAALTAATTILGDPCGALGNGAIFDAVGGADQAGLDLRLAMQQIRDLIAEADIEAARVDAECGGRVAIADLQFDAAGETITLQQTISTTQNAIAAWEKELAELDRTSKSILTKAQLASSVGGAVDACIPGIPPFDKPTPGACVAGVVASGLTLGASIVEDVALGTQIAANTDIKKKEGDIVALERQIAETKRTAEYDAAIAECCLDPDGQGDPTTCDAPGPLMVNSNARVDTILIGLQRARLQALRAELDVQLASGRLSLLRSKAQRLVAQQEDTEELLINVEASRNDPNVRIMKNFDVLDADKSFKDALVDAYRATRVWEYYTAQTYARKDELFLARLVGRGDHNVENYLLDLQRALREFEESFGRPSPRVQIVSLKDDVFRVPRLRQDGTAYRADERDRLFRERLDDVALLDERGYISIPFSTTLQMTSPLTAIHKIDGVEIDLYGDGLGDRVARVYLTARGTGTVRSLDDELVYHRFPAITAVVNPIFNGSKVLDPAIYKNGRLRDRPFVNSTWELGLNQRDELVNEDIDLHGLTDVRLYYYYEDFTILE